MEFWCKEKGHFNLDQAALFKELVKKHKPKYVLETGFCTGRSAISVLSNADDLLKMISIDINFGLTYPGRKYRKLLTTNFSKFSTIEKSSHDVLNKNFLDTEFPNGVDWFTVDGDHSYKGCLNDLESVHNHINKGGLVIIDDYNSGPPNGCSIPQVTKACDDFYLKHPELKREQWNNKGKGFCIFYYH